MIKNLFSLPVQKSITEDLKITNFTEIQERCIPVIMEGKNLIGVSETGSGKTLSFVLPLIDKIIGLPKRPTRILIITPTKELSEQILAVVKKVCRHTNLISMSLYGGNSFDSQTKDLKNGVHIVVACPGRLKDHIEKETIDLSGIEYLVLDEADQLMDMGFLPALTVALNATVKRKQTLLFSATVSPEIEELVRDFMPESTKVQLHETKPKEIISENFCPISPELKYPFLRFLLKHKKIKACLIFTRTKDEANALGAQLVLDNYHAVTLQGDMTTHQRKKALDALKQKSAHILVATDVVSRGIDIPHVTHVINFTPSESLEAYVHRIGRTARHDKAGEAITLFTKDEEYLLAKIFKDKKYPVTKFKEFNYQLKIEKKKLVIIKEKEKNLESDDQSDFDSSYVYDPKDYDEE
ncbi:MAG: DEAD/DEAH box helicase [Bacteriovorax sp.]|nr:DEAD/DEAH box helicase [Bacteriovorax sp.]